MELCREWPDVGVTACATMGFVREELMAPDCWEWPFLAASSLRRRGGFTVGSARRVGLRDWKRGGRGTSASLSGGGGVGDLDVCVTVGDTAVSSSTETISTQDKTDAPRDVRVEALVCMRTGDERDRCMEIIV